MRTYHFTRTAVLAVLILGFGSRTVQARKPDQLTGAPVQMVITAEARRGSDIPALAKEDVMVYQGHERDSVIDWVPLQGEHAQLQLFLLMDDASRTSLGTQLEELRQFINSQPATTAIGIGYMRDATVEVVQNFTNDHAQAEKALRLPTGTVGALSSPYVSLVDLIKRWPGQPPHEVLLNRWPDIPVRHEVLMITDGIDRLGGTGASNPYVDSATEEAQRAGVIVYAIFASGIGHYGRSFWRVNWGQNYLSQIADETGGEAYILGFETAVSFKPYLDQIAGRLNHQFLLAFMAKPGKKSELQPVKIRAEEPNVELVAAAKVYVPAQSE